MTWIWILVLLLALRLLCKARACRRHQTPDLGEPERLEELRRFGSALSLVSPELITFEEVIKMTGPNGRESSAVVAKRLLDLFDSIEGPVVGEYIPSGREGQTIRWPYVAARHALRGHAPERTISSTSLPFVLPQHLRARHVNITGKTGTGKTTLLRRLILQDAAAEVGLGVIGPEQEFLVEEILPFLPENRWDDVIYINPSDTGRPVPLNPLHVDDGEDLDLKADETFTILRRAMIDDAGTGAPRLEHILGRTTTTLTSIPGTTLLDIPRLLDRADDSYRTWAVAQLRDEGLRHFWTSEYPLYPKDAHLSLMNRLGRFLEPKVVRNILCQPHGSLNVRAAMDSGKIILPNLSDGILGEQNSKLLGQLWVAKIQMAAMSRANVPKDVRRPFHLYIDEFQSFCGVAGASYELILSRARKYALMLTLAQQQLGSVPESVMREILGNVASLIVFRVGATDAHRLGRELAGAAPHFDHRLLTSLKKGEACCLFDRALLIAQTSPPPGGGSNAVRDEIIRRSRERFGVTPGVTPRLHPSLSIDDLELGDVF